MSDTSLSYCAKRYFCPKTSEEFSKNGQSTNTIEELKLNVSTASKEEERCTRWLTNELSAQTHLCSDSSKHMLLVRVLGQ